MGLSIHVLTTDGSPLGVSYKSIWGDEWYIGCGGAESSMLTLCEAWTKQGHTVVLYNQPKEKDASPFEQRNVNDFNPDDNRDILINFRTPNKFTVTSKGLRVWFSCDQFTAGSYAGFAKYVDKIVCISPFHQQHFLKEYKIENSIVIDLPVRTMDYDDKDIKKVKNRLIFTSVPRRGLDILCKMWGSIQKQVPDVSLVITSDYRLWGTPFPQDEEYRVNWLTHATSAVSYLGAISRSRLIEEQLKADILAYPCVYDELFCITVTEAMYAGVYPITSGVGALPTTNAGTVITEPVQDSLFRKKLIDEVVYLLQNRDELKKRQDNMKKIATERFSIDTVLKKWDEEVFK